MKLVKIFKHNLVHQINNKCASISMFQCASSMLTPSFQDSSQLVNTSLTFYSVKKSSLSRSASKRTKKQEKRKQVRFNLNNTSLTGNNYQLNSSFSHEKESVRNLLETSKTISLSNKKKFKKSSTKRKSASIIVKRIGRNANNIIIDDNGQIFFTNAQNDLANHSEESEDSDQELREEYELPKEPFQPILPNQINYILQNNQKPQFPINSNISLVNIMQNDAVINHKPPVSASASKATTIRKSQPQMGVRALFTKRVLSNQDLTDQAQHQQQPPQSSNPKKRERSDSNFSLIKRNYDEISCLSCKNASCQCSKATIESFSLNKQPSVCKSTTPFLDTMEYSRKFARSSSYANMSTVNMTVTNQQVELNVTPIKPMYRKSCKTVKKLSCLSLNPNGNINQQQQSPYVNVKNVATAYVGHKSTTPAYSTYV